MNRKLLLASLLAVSVAVSFSAVAHENKTRMFGYHGQNGGDGVSGFRGQSYGRQAITVAPGSGPVAYNFSGGTGGDGGNGVNGTNAGNCYTQYNIDDDLLGASGGSGGNAGVGGDGGNGGDVTVTYTPSLSGNPLADLKNVAVYLGGGQPGRSGAAGRGAYPCRCQVRHWRYTRRVPVTQRICEPAPVPSPMPSPAPSPLPPVCRDVIVYVDQVVDHYCNDGRYGQDGQTSQASYGRPGSVTLIPTDKPTIAEFPSASFAVGQLPWSNTLTEDKWSYGTGAQLLFAPGSIVGDSYNYYAGRTFSAAKVVWNAKRSNSDVTAVSFSVSLRNGNLSSTHDSSKLWAAVSKRVDTAGTTFSVDAAATPAEAMKVKAEITGTDANTAILLTDASGISDIVQTSAYAKLESKGVFWWTRFENDVPAGQIEVLSPTQVLIHVGRFWPSGNMGDLKPGKEVRFTITIGRRLGEDSGNQPAVKLQRKL